LSVRPSPRQNHRSCQHRPPQHTFCQVRHTASITEEVAALPTKQDTIGFLPVRASNSTVP
jgi:hypothetical protein